MSAFPPLVPVAPVSAVSPDLPVAPQASAAAPGGFTRLLLDGVERANAKVLSAEAQTRAFALGEDIPVHQVTLALEEARLSFELVAQVRNRLVESYQELMRMQV